MNSSLRLFICELLGVVLAALVPVVLVPVDSLTRSLAAGVALVLMAQEEMERHQPRGWQAQTAA